MQPEKIMIEVQKLLDEMSAIIGNSTWRNKYSTALRNLQEDLNTPCVLAIAGKVKAGKSFLVNALLGVDIAMTGNTETTATINIFKKGTPPTEDKPILCHFVDGHKEWVSKDYLESLQGTSDEALAKTAQIDKLVMYINDNPLLDHVTLVDTPGIGANVGEDGDAHQIHTDAYFKLRERHQQETINLSNTADAIIYLFNTVPTETDKTFLASLYDGGNGVTSLNGIGVLSKIDKDITQMENIPRFCSEFEHNLFTIIPTSAAIEKYLPSVEDADRLRDKLRKGFTQEKGVLLALGSENAFLHEKLPYCNMSVFERKAILNNFAETDIAWSSFALIAKELYYADDVAIALEKLKSIGGIKQLRDTIFKHFFNRSHMLRCNKIIEELRCIVNNIIFDESFVYAEDKAQMKENCINACQSLPSSVRVFVIELIKESLPSVQQVQKEKECILRMREKLEKINAELRIVNECFLTYQKVVAAKEQFSQIETDELCALFAGQTRSVDLCNRYKYWASVYNTAFVNSIRQHAAKIAKIKYAELLNN